MSIVTLAVLVLIIFLSRAELARAWELLGRANIWLLMLLVPFQIIVYFAGGEMIFAYLRDKKLIGHIWRFEQTRIALELNLVNHIFPSARSTFAQVIRYVTGFLSLMVLLILAVLVLSIDGQVNRYIVTSSFLLVLVVLALTFGLIFMFSSRKRMHNTAVRVSRVVNAVVRWATLGKIKRLLVSTKIEAFFAEMHDDFVELSEHRRLLIKPLVWGAIYAIFDVLMFIVAFWALGVSVNPAVLIIGYGVAGLASLVAFTPGGAGVYEAIMIVFLSMTGVAPDVAIAGIVLTRVILLAGTIIFGYIFYQHALIKYGRPDDDDGAAV